MTEHTEERPLVTFALFAYNQERFIREAVEGALAQTYSPLQVILSDDCSSDRTFEIMQEMVAEYSGPHEILLNRNERNLGIGAHVNRLMELAKGELIVGAAGDDISYPERTLMLVKRWLECDKRICSIYSEMKIIDENGSILGKQSSPPYLGSLKEKIGNFMPGVQGASHAWQKRIFDQFGNLLPGTVCEDRVISFRSELLGGVEYIQEPLVLYRVHGKNISHFNQLIYANDESIISTTVSIHQRNINILKNYLIDIETALRNRILDSKYASSLSLLVAEKINKIQAKIEFMTGDNKKKLYLILSNFMRNPAQSSRWVIMLMFPRFYLNNQKKNFKIT